MATIDNDEAERLYLFKHRRIIDISGLLLLIALLICVILIHTWYEWVTGFLGMSIITMVIVFLGPILTFRQIERIRNERLGIWFSSAVFHTLINRLFFYMVAGFFIGLSINISLDLFLKRSPPDYLSLPIPVILLVLLAFLKRAIKDSGTRVREFSKLPDELEQTVIHGLEQAGYDANQLEITKDKGYGNTIRIKPLSVTIYLSGEKGGLSRLAISSSGSSSIGNIKLIEDTISSVAKDI